MDRLRRSMMYFVLMGMFLLTAGVGTFKLAASDLMSSSVVEEVDDEVDQPISSQAVTEFTFDENSPSISLPSGTISVDTTYTYKNRVFTSIFDSTATVNSGVNLNIIFDGCSFFCSNYGFSGTGITNNGKMNITFQDCFISMTIPFLGPLSGETNVAINNAIITSGTNVPFVTSPPTTFWMQDVYIASNAAISSFPTNVQAKNVYYGTADSWENFIKKTISSDVRNFTSSESTLWSTNWDFDNKWIYYSHSSLSTSEGLLPITRAGAKHLGWSSSSISVAVYANYDSMTTANAATRISYPAPVNGSVTLSSANPIFTRNGYKNKWAYSPDGQGADNLTFTQNGAAYAIWSPETYTITYDAPSGNIVPSSNWDGGNTSSVTRQYKITDTLVLPTASQATRVGYTATGWIVQNTVGSWTVGAKFSPGQSLTNQWGTVELDAQWTPNVYKITLDPNFTGLHMPTGGTSSNANPLIVYERYNDNWYTSGTSFTDSTKITSLTTCPTYSGYDFKGYWTTPSGEGTQVISDAGDFIADRTTEFYEVDENGSPLDGTLYARWEGKEIKLTLNGNEPNTDCSHTEIYVKYWDALLHASGSTAQVNLTLPTKTGYTFDGWTKTLNGTDIVVDAGETPRLVTGTNFVTTDDGGAIVWASPTDVTLYAKWNPNPYKVTLDKNGGTGGTDEYWYKFNIEKFYSDNTFESQLTAIVAPTRTGYTFAGYYTSPSVTASAQYVNAQGAWVNGGLYNSASDSTLYAKWTPNIYEITLDSGLYNAETDENPASGATETGTGVMWVRYDDAWYSDALCGDAHKLTNLPILPNKTGYTFNGYWTTKMTEDSLEAVQVVDATGKILDGKTNLFHDGIEIGKRKLYAHWVVKTYSIVINYAGCNASADKPEIMLSGSVDTRVLEANKDKLTAGNSLTIDNVAFGSAIDITITIQELTNEFGARTFVINVGGGPSIDSLDYAEISGYVGDEDQTFNVYVSEKFTLTFDGNRTESADVVGTQQFLYGEAVDLSGVDTPTRENFTFTKWKTEDGREYEPASKYNQNGDENSSAILYAQWTGDLYTIKLDSRNGDNVVTSDLSQIIEKYGTGFFRTIDCADADKITGGLKPVSKGYVFTGYYIIEADGSERQVVNANGEIRVENIYFNINNTDSDKSVTIYAKWEAGQYKVTFNTNGRGTFSVDENGAAGQPTKNLDVVYDAPISFNVETDNLSITEVKGYQLDGWYTATTDGDKILNADGSSAGVSKYIDADGKWIFAPDFSSKEVDGTEILVQDPIILYAHWTPITYHFDVNYKDFGGTDAATDLKVTATGSASVSSETLKYENGNGTVRVSVVYSDNAPKVTITVESLAGKNYIISGSSISGIGELSNVCAFDWAPEASGSQDIYVLQTYTISYDLNGGDGTVSSTTKAYGIAANVTAS